MNLEGVVLPVTTPFDETTGELAPIPFRQNLRRWLSHDVDGIVVAGSTGEAPLLDEGEIVDLVEWARDVVPPERILIAGIGSESTRKTVRLAREVAHRGADAVLVRPPSYYRKLMDAAALQRHFESVADAAPIPVVLYHVPVFVPVEIGASLLADLAAHANVLGIKDSSGDLKGLGQFLDAAAGECRVMVGSGSHLYAALEMGAAGGIVAVGCLAPSIALEVYRQFKAGSSGPAGAAQSRLNGPNDTIVRGLGVPAIKYALDLLDYTGGSPRPPLRGLDEGQRAQVRDQLGAAGLLPDG